MKKLIKLFSVLAIATTMLVACSSGTTDAPKKQDSADAKQEQKTESDANVSKIDAIKAKGELVMGTSADYPPFEFHKIEGTNDEIVGFDIALAQKMADELGVKLVIKDMDFNLIIEDLKNGNIDVALAGLNNTAERLEVIDMTEPYWNSDMTVLIKKDDNSITDTTSLEGKKIGVQIGTIQEELAKGIKDAKITAVTKVPALVEQLKAGAIDAVVLEVPIAEQFEKATDGVKVAKDVIFKDDLGVSIAIKKGDKDLLDLANEFIKKEKESGSLDKMMVEATQLSESMNN